MPIIIKKFKSKRKWLYLWGKYINGVDLDFHCAKSLLGQYTKKLDKNSIELNDIVLNEADSNIFYICGVTKPYVWEDNFHLALEYKEGNNIKINRKGIELEILNAQELPINFDIENCNNKNKSKKEYSTCRNWQFAYIYKNLIERRDNNG